MTMATRQRIRTRSSSSIPTERCTYTCKGSGGYVSNQVGVAQIDWLKRELGVLADMLDEFVHKR